MSWLRCLLHGHKINLFPADAPNVGRLAYTCGCQRRFVTRATRERTLHERLAAFEGGAA